MRILIHPKLNIVPFRIVLPKESPVMEIVKPKAAPMISHRTPGKGKQCAVKKKSTKTDLCQIEMWLFDRLERG